MKMLGHCKMFKVFLLVYHAGLVTSVACPEGYQYYEATEKCYGMSSTTASYYTARNKCERAPFIGGSIVDEIDDALHEFLTDKIIGKSQPWIGLFMLRNRKGNKYYWTTSDTEEISESNSHWCSGQPSGSSFDWGYYVQSRSGPCWALSSSSANKLALCENSAFAIPAFEARVAPQIIGGRDARVGEFPWQGSLQRLGRRMAVETFPGHTCGCVLISNTWIVTAAHCVGAGPFGLYVVMGLHTRGDTSVGAPVGYYIEEITSNPNWNRRTLQGDIALIKLISPVEMNQYVRTIEMHSAGTNLDGASCTISGWGVTTVGGGSSAITLQAADVKALSVAECQGYWSNTGEGHICVWEQGSKGACNGDSGGPCVCNGKLAGVTSFGQRGCYPNTPSAYTRISFYRDWIRSTSGV